MRLTTSGALAGLIGGAVVAAVMAGGRRSGVLDKTLMEESKDWLDAHFATRDRVGEAGTELLAQSDHLSASAAFGMAYASVRPYLRRFPWYTAGAAYGAGLYIVNIVGLAPLLGLTHGEREAPAPVVGQRLGLHVLFGTVTALAYAMLTKGTSKR